MHLSYINKDIFSYDISIYAMICLCPKNVKSQNWGNAPSETGSFDGEEWAEDVDYDPAAQVAGEEYFDDKWGEDLNEESSLAKDRLTCFFCLCILLFVVDDHCHWSSFLGRKTTHSFGRFCRSRWSRKSSRWPSAYGWHGRYGWRRLRWRSLLCKWDSKWIGLPW